MMNIAELAEAAGLSRRAVRFYVQQQLLPPPAGRGRGGHYDASHLARLRRIADLQAAGHSLDAIRRIFEGGAAPPSPTAPRRPARAMLAAELWTRLTLMRGVELHFDAGRHQPAAEKLLALREAVRECFADDAEGADEKSGERAEE